MNYLLFKKVRLLVSILGLTIFISSYCYGQTQIITSKYDQTSWLNFIDEIEKNHHVQFYFDKGILPDFKISVKNDTSSLKEIIVQSLKPFNIQVSFDHAGNIFLTKESKLLTELAPNFFRIPEKVKKKTIENLKEQIGDDNYLKTTQDYFAQTYVIGTTDKGRNKPKATISGYIKSFETGNPILGATVMQTDLGIGIAANDEGFYKFTIDKGKHVLTINSVASVERKMEVEVLSDGNLDILLSDDIIMLEDVVVSAQKYSKVKGTAMGIERVPMVAVKKIPLVFGERDVLKVALLLPGVQSIGEGSAGFNVRGSPTDQNIFYINNVPIYNTSHVAGFFSAFNSDAIDEFSLYKNYIPVRYGGRLASVFDIKSQQGSLDKTKVRGGIGLITGRVLAEGPIQEEKSSYMLAFRSTYSDWLLSMIDDQEISKSKVKFGDVISNFHFQLDDKNQLDLFAYVSNDNMDLATKSKYDYQNIASSVNWNHYFNHNLSFKLSLAHSSYSFDEENTENLSFSYKHINKLKHSEVNANLNLQANENHTLTFGINSILYNIDRGNPKPLTEESQFIPISLGSEKGFESGIYLSDEWNITPDLTFNGGIRYNLYSYLGPQKVYTYQEGFSKSESSIQDTLFFDKNEAIKTFHGLDFRLAANYMITNDLSLKIAYNRLHQYLYMLSNTVAIAPNYKWKLTDYNTEPMVGDQYSIGIFANIPAYRIELSVEGYYKKVKNLVALKNGASLFLNEFVERSTLQGNLDAYGIEIMLKKPFGKITGWINYTYSSSKALIDSEIQENRINFGEPYPSNYDKPHALNFVINRDFSKRFSMSANFVYATGRPITLPTSIYYLNGVKYLNYSKRNEHRIPDYIRLDLSFNLEGNLKKRKLAHGYWSFSIYNVLGRNNAYSVYFVNEGNQIKGYKFSIFGSPVYSLSYNFKLGNYDN